MPCTSHPFSKNTPDNGAISGCVQRAVVFFTLICSITACGKLRGWPNLLSLPFGHAPSHCPQVRDISAGRRCRNLGRIKDRQRGSGVTTRPTGNVLYLFRQKAIARSEMMGR